MKPDTIIRVKKDGNYAVISNEPLNDDRLSWEAKGVLAYLLTKPNDWEVRNRDLERKGKVGAYKLSRILAELKQTGYLSRERRHLPDGTFEWVTTVFEKSTMTRLSVDGSPVDGSPVDGKPRDIVITESVNTESLSTEPPTAPGITYPVIEESVTLTRTERQAQTEGDWSLQEAPRRTDARVKGDLLDGMLFADLVSKTLDVDSWLPPDLADLARPMCKIIGITSPADETGRKRWIKELANWRTNSRTPAQVENVARHMIKEKLTCTGPWSLSGMLADPTIAKGSRPLPTGYRPGIDPDPATGFIDFIPGVSQL